MHEQARSEPLVSIGMPVRNGGKYIGEALDSLLAQSYERFELIVSDNASTDATQETCLEYAARDNRITYHRNSENVGIVRNHSRVFELSSGAYFVWASYDDLWDPTFIARSLEVLRRTPSAVLCYPQAKFIGPAGEPIDYTFPSFDTSGTTTMGMDIVSRLHVHMWGVTYPFQVKCLMSSRAIAQTRLDRDTLNFDLHLLTELSLLGEFAHIPEPLFYNRVKRQGDFLDQLAALTDEVGKSVTTRWAALYHCTRMVYGNVEAVNRHTPRVRDKAVLIPAAVFCTLVKQRPLMRGLFDLSKRNRSRLPGE